MWWHGPALGTQLVSGDRLARGERLGLSGRDEVALFEVVREQLCKAPGTQGLVHPALQEVDARGAVALDEYGAAWCEGDVPSDHATALEGSVCSHDQGQGLIPAGKCLSTKRTLGFRVNVGPNCLWAESDGTGKSSGQDLRNQGTCRKDQERFPADVTVAMGGNSQPPLKFQASPCK